MRTRRLFVLTLVVLFLHGVGWRLAGGSRPSLATPRAGVHLVASVSVPTGARVPLSLFEPGPVRDAVAHAAPARMPPRPAAGRPRGPATSGRRPPAGNGGGATSGLAAAVPWPVYATQAPPSTSLHYALAQRNSAAASAATPGQATLEWTNTGEAFSLRIVAATDERPPREWESTGAFDAAGIAPIRLVERERGRDKRTVNFDRDNARVRFSGASDAPPIAPGAQDRWSWVAQLAAIAEAGVRHGRLAGPWDLQVAGLRGDLERWTFRVLPPGDPPAELASQGNELSASGGRAPALLHVLRATEHPYDLRVEAWLSPALHHFPAGLRMSTPPGPWSLALWQRH